MKAKNDPTRRGRKSAAALPRSAARATAAPPRREAHDASLAVVDGCCCRECKDARRARYGPPLHQRT